MNNHRFPSPNDSLKFNGQTSVVTRTDLSIGDNFNVSWNAVGAISSYFQSQFQHSVPGNYVGCNAAWTSYPNCSVNGYFKADNGSFTYEPIVLQPFYNSSNLNATFASIARSMSNALRAGDTNQTGTVNTAQLYYHIEWPWLGLHVVVTLAGTIFLIATAVNTRRCRAPAWKSSSLALIEIGRRFRGLLDGADTVDDLVARAKGKYVLLSDADVKEGEDDGGNTIELTI